MKKNDWIILVFILVVAFAFRLYKIDSPLADYHSWRQVDTAAVARNFVRNGFDLLRPTYDDLSSIQTGIENPEGLRFVEFPIYNAMFGFFYRYFPVLSLEIYGRLTSIFFSLLIIAVLYYLSLKEHSRIAAVSASIIYATFPFFVFFSRVVLPETMSVSLMMLSIFTVYKYLEKDKHPVLWLIFGMIFYALSILVKPTSIFYTFVIAFQFIRKYRFDVFKKWQIYIFAFVGLAPFIAWRAYISQYPVGIPASSWLIAYVNTFEGSKNIFFRPAFFRWIFMERIGTQIFGIFMTGFMIFGIIGKYKRYLPLVMFFSALIYLFTFQGGNVQHEYYQTIAFPGLAIIAGCGIGFIVQSKLTSNLYFAYPVIIGWMILSWSFSYYKVKDYYSYPQDLVQVAELIQSFTKPDDLIVTDRLGDTTLLYLADRKGAPAVYKNVAQLKALGYDYLVTAKKDYAKNLKDEGYTLLVENDQFSIVKLN